jgi:hypothetical protein
VPNALSDALRSELEMWAWHRLIDFLLDYATRRRRSDSEHHSSLESGGSDKELIAGRLQVEKI